MNNIIKKTKKFFLSGLLVLLPIGISLYIIAKVFNMLDSLLGNPIEKLIGFKIPGLGLFLALLFIFLTGVIASNVIGKKITSYIERLFKKIPVLKTVYMPIKDIFANFTNNQSNNFKKAVLVEFPRRNTLSIGFITKENVIVGGLEKTVVFVPTTPNPTSGYLVYLSINDYKELDMPVDTALKAIISLGAVSPDIINLSKEVDK